MSWYFLFSANKDTDCSIWRHVASRHISTRKYIRGFSPEIRFFQSFAFAKCTTIEVFYLTSKTVRCSGCDVFFRGFFFKCKAILHKTLKFYPCKFTDLLIFYTLTDDGLFMYIREEIWQTSLCQYFFVCFIVFDRSVYKYSF